MQCFQLCCENILSALDNGFRMQPSHFVPFSADVARAVQGFPVDAAASNMWSAGAMLVLTATHHSPFRADGSPRAIEKLHKSWARILISLPNTSIPLTHARIAHRRHAVVQV